PASASRARWVFSGTRASARISAPAPRSPFRTPPRLGLSPFMNGLVGRPGSEFAFRRFLESNERSDRPGCSADFQSAVLGIYLDVGCWSLELPSAFLRPSDFGLRISS